MIHRLTRISVTQTAATFAVLYFVVTAIVCIPIAAISMIADKGEHWIKDLGMLLVPPLYAIVAFLGFALVAALYNWIAKMTGGVEFTLTDLGEEPPSAA